MPREVQLILQSETIPYLMEDRKASVALTDSQFWLNAFLSEQSIMPIETDRALFEQLVEITNARYSVAVGLVRHQNLARAELELVRLEDRLAMLRQQQQINIQILAQCLAEAVDFFKEHPRMLANNKRIQATENGIEITKQSLKPSYSAGFSYGYRGGT